MTLPCHPQIADPSTGPAARAGIRPLGVILLTALLAGGCTTDPDAYETTAGGDAADEATVFDPMVGTLDKARTAQDSIDAHTDRLRSQIDGMGADASGEDDNP